jgi:hypothetical protein
MKLKHITLAFLFTLPSLSHGVTAWLPEAGSGSVETSFVASTFDSFLLGSSALDSPLGGSVDQYSLRAGVTFGLTEWLAVDASTGFAWVKDDGFTGLDDSGLDDSRIGLTVGLTDDEGAVPALALRAGAIIGGSYDTNAPYSLGDGANGVEVSLLWGKSLGDTGFSVLGDVGYRWRDDDVPEDLFFSAGVAKSFYLGGGDSSINLYAGYRFTEGQSGGDIGGPGFGSAFGFPQTREEQQGLDFALGYTDAGGRSYTLGYSHVIEGRNTPERDVFSLSITLPF